MPDGPIRIALFGPESTGKSRLAERLALHFGEPWAPEFVRAFWDARAGRIVAADLAEIARGQIAAEEAAAARARGGHPTAGAATHPPERPPVARYLRG